MHHTLRTFLAVLLTALLLCLPALTLAAPGEATDFLYTESDDGTAEITGLTEAAGPAVQIPAEIDGHAVTSIAAGAFRNTAVTQVDVPAGVRRIGAEAFAGCTALQSVTLPTSATELGTGIFAGSSLQTFTIPAGIGVVPQDTFSGCTALTAITVPVSVETVSEGAFSGCSNLRDVYYTGTQEEFAAITVQAGNALFTGASLHALSTSPEGFLYNLEGTSVGDNITVQISGLEDPSQSGSLVIPAALDGYPVTEIGDNAFRNCRGVTEAELPDSLTHIGRSAFQDCTALTAVTFGDALVALDDAAFQGCTALQSATLPDSVQSVGAYAFAACSNLKSLVLPKTCPTPGDYALAYSGLIAFQVPRSWNNIPKGTFEGCSSLTSVTVPASVYSVGEQAFGGCGQLEHVYFLGSQAEAESIRIEPGNAPFEHAAKTVSNLILSIEPAPDGGQYIIGAAVSVFGLEAASVLLPLQAETSADAYICAYGSDTEPAAGSDVVRTGMTARWGTSSGEESAQFVIMGDVAGSGQLNIVQLVTMAKALTGLKTLDGPFLAAADWDGNGSVDIADLMREAELFLSTSGN